MTTQALIVCADDFALDSGVSTAIAQLAEQGRISATSAMSLSPDWPEHARWLKPLSPHIDVGLHLDWTSPFAITAGHGCSLPQLMQRTLTRSLNRQQARTVIDTQLDRFEAAWGAAPAHVDGHQHIHQFPIIREALVQSLTVRYPRGQRPWLRVSRPLAPGLDIKSRVIQGMGAAALQQQAQQAGLPHSSWLTGIYGFSGTAADYEARMNTWLAQAHGHQGVVLMCHPGHDTSSTDDAIRAARSVEFGFLAGAAFTALLAHHQWHPACGQAALQAA